MFDTVNFRLTKNDVEGVDFLSETSCYIDNIGEHYYNEEPFLSGSLNGLKISINRNGVSIKDGSLCKWYLGDNFQTMGRADIKQAVEKLSDTLHLPIDKAIITRMDVAQNIILKHPTSVYLKHLGACYPFKRLEQADGLYYVNKKNQFVFYDKVKEQKAKGEKIPELYSNSHTLRVEQRYKKQLSKTLGTETVTAEHLYNELFYINIVKRWKQAYSDIKKVNDIIINFEEMKGKKDFDLAGRLCLIQQRGGELAMIGEITDAYRRGDITRRQADELKRATREACKVKANFVTQNEAIKELDKKINEATRFYR